jgi:cytosine/adenosine deaminase-related metal-dependent hydrolase
MSTPKRILTAIAVAACRLASAAADESSHDAEAGAFALVLRDVNIVAIDDGKIVPHQTVVIRGSNIVSVSPDGARAFAAGAVVVNGSGKFLIPGLVEGHAHLPTEKMFQDRRQKQPGRTPDVDLDQLHAFDQHILMQFLRFGVTSVFNYGNSAPDGGGLLEIRNAIASGKLLGPRLIVGKRIDGSRGVMLEEIPATRVPSSIDAPQMAEHARLAVLRAKSLGYDFIKIYQHVDAETYFAVLRTAQEQGMRVAGHLPELNCARCMRREQAFEEPLDAIAHLEELSRYGMQTDFSAEDLHYLTGLVRASGASVVSTLVASRSIVHMYAYRQLPPLDPQDVRLVDSLTLRDWLGPNNRYLSEPFRRQQGAELFPAAYDYQRALARHLWKAGVRLVVGTDAPIPGVSYGSAVIDEMIELNKIGLRPHEVLQAGTRNALLSLGQGDAGKISAGARADLVLLEANPLDYIGNLRAISGVIAAGRWLPIERLRADSEAAVRYFRSLDRKLGIKSDRR